MEEEFQRLSTQFFLSSFSCFLRLDGGDSRGLFSRFLWRPSPLSQLLPPPIESLSSKNPQIPLRVQVHLPLFSSPAGKRT